eukprot:2905582-Rhodomonas_salina.1
MGTEHGSGSRGPNGRVRRDSRNVMTVLIAASFLYHQYPPPRNCRFNAYKRENCTSTLAHVCAATTSRPSSPADTKRVPAGLYATLQT